MSTAIKTKLPKVIVVDDYHDIFHRAELISDVLDTRVKGYEIGYVEDCGYMGVIYVGRRPDVEQVVPLVKKFLVRDLNIKENEMSHKDWKRFARGGNSIYFDDAEHRYVVE